MLFIRSSPNGGPLFFAAQCRLHFRAVYRRTTPGKEIENESNQCLPPINPCLKKSGTIADIVPTTSQEPVRLNGVFCPEGKVALSARFETIRFATKLFETKQPRLRRLPFGWGISQGTKELRRTAPSGSNQSATIIGLLDTKARAGPWEKLASPPYLPRLS